MPAMSGHLVGPAQLVSATVLGSAHPGPTSTDHAHRWSLAMSQPDCWQSIFTERLPGMVDPRARQTRRAAGILRLLGHGVGGRPGERLAARLGFAAKRGTTLRHLIRHQRLPDHSAPRVIGIDERASRKGLRFGTIAVDLERREVIDVLPSASLRYSRLVVFATSASPLASKRLVLQFRTKACVRFTPLYAGRRLPSHQAPGRLVPGDRNALVLTTVLWLTTHLRRVLAFVSLTLTCSRFSLNFVSNAHHRDS